MQSGKISLTSWPDVKLIPQTNKQSRMWHICNVHATFSPLYQVWGSEKQVPPTVALVAGCTRTAILLATAELINQLLGGSTMILLPFIITVGTLVVSLYSAPFIALNTTAASSSLLLGPQVSDKRYCYWLLDMDQNTPKHLPPG